MPHIAIIILNYLGYQDTCSCVESVRRELSDAKIFIVDNSESASEKRLLKKKFGADSSIKILFPERNLGFAAGVNLAIKAAIDSGFKHFFLLNNDAVLLHGSGPYIEHALRQHPATIIAPTIRWGDHTVCGSSYHKYFGLIYSRSWKRSRYGWFDYITGCAFMLDITCIEKIGILDEDFFMYGEDVEYSHRALQKGCKLTILNDVLVAHDGSKSSKKNSFFYEYHVNRGHFLLSKKLHGSLLKRIISLILKGCFLATRAIYRSMASKTFGPLKGFLLAPFPIYIRP